MIAVPEIAFINPGKFLGEFDRFYRFGGAKVLGGLKGLLKGFDVLGSSWSGQVGGFCGEGHKQDRYDYQATSYILHKASLPRDRLYQKKLDLARKRIKRMSTEVSTPIR